MKEQIIEYLVANQMRLASETASLKRDRDAMLKKESPDFHDIIKTQYQDKLRGHIIRELSMNAGIDYESSMIELEGIDLDSVLFPKVK